MDFEMPPVLLIILILGSSVLILLFVACVGYVLGAFCRSTSKRASQREPTLSMYTTFHKSTLEEESMAVRKQYGASKHSDTQPSVHYSMDDWERLFEKSVKEFGLLMHSFRCRDELNEFWEANFRAGQFRQPFVVRSLRSNATPSQIEYFQKLQMGTIRLPTHPNILKVIGLSKDTFPCRIYYEYHEETSLHDVIHNESKGRVSWNTVQFLHFAKQIANGMEFLKANEFDHVAVRTERVLYFKDDVCKLFDFCLSSQSAKIALHLRDKNEALAWLAPELLWKGKYYLWTDIWAFGVVLWELWSLGKTPCVGKSLTELQTDLKYQRFLGPPNSCPAAIFSLMVDCWKSVPFERKPFNEIKLELERLINNPEKLHQPTDAHNSQLYLNFSTIRGNNM